MPVSGFEPGSSAMRGNDADRYTTEDLTFKPAEELTQCK